MEAYAIATMRNLPDPHPVYKLLRQHFRYTMAINTSARASLINNGGIIDQLFAIGRSMKQIIGVGMVTVKKILIVLIASQILLLCSLSSYIALVVVPL